MNNNQKICSNCGTLNNYKVKCKGNTLIALILLCCYFIPGIIYVLWSGSNAYICSSCDGKDTMLDTSTPVGKQIYQKYYNTSSNPDDVKDADFKEVK